ncbi:uncharacterized protein PG998_000015 [Apiospora kogelbergensis]|uniref:uncharacterized protein n=1 Tax=Apiospora kogelbergensis TaxID=1337665 RepID=UPI003131C53A
MSAASNNGGGGNSSLDAKLDDIINNRRKGGRKQPRDNTLPQGGSMAGSNVAPKTGQSAKRPRDEESDAGEVPQGVFKSVFDKRARIEWARLTDVVQHKGAFSYPSVTRRSLENNKRRAEEIIAKNDSRAREWKAQQALTAKGGYRFDQQTDNQSDAVPKRPRIETGLPDVESSLSIEGYCAGTAELNEIFARFTERHKGKMHFVLRSVSDKEWADMKLVEELKAQHASAAKSGHRFDHQAGGQSDGGNGHKDISVVDGVDNRWTTSSRGGQASRGRRPEPAPNTFNAQLDLEMREYWSEEEHDRAL